MCYPDCISAKNLGIVLVIKTLLYFKTIVIATQFMTSTVWIMNFFACQICFFCSMLNENNVVDLYSSETGDLYSLLVFHTALLCGVSLVRQLPVELLNSTYLQSTVYWHGMHCSHRSIILTPAYFTF